MKGGELFFEDFCDQDEFTSQIYLSMHIKHVMLHPTSSTYIPAFIQFLLESQLWKDAAEMLTKTLKTPTTAVIAEHVDLLVDMRYLLSRFNVRWKPYKMWIAFAKLYEVHDHISTARAIFDMAMQMDYYISVEELVTLWEEWADMEMVYGNSAGVLELIRRATAEPSVEEVRP